MFHHFFLTKCQQIFLDPSKLSLEIEHNLKKKRITQLIVVVLTSFFVCVQVRVWEEVRSVDTQEFRELQSLYEESQLRRQQVCQHPQVPLIYKMLLLSY